MQHLELKDLGFDDWFRGKQEETRELGYSVARVTAVDRASYLVRNESSEVPQASFSMPPNQVWICHASEIGSMCNTTTRTL